MGAYKKSRMPTAFYKESQCGSICVCSACVYCGHFQCVLCGTEIKYLRRKLAADKTLSQTQTQKGVKKNGEAGTTSEVLNADGVTQEQQTSGESGDSAGDSQEAQENENAQDG